jgi:hypothetical protein
MYLAKLQCFFSVNFSFENLSRMTFIKDFRVFVATLPDRMMLIFSSILGIQRLAFLSFSSSYMMCNLKSFYNLLHLFFCKLALNLAAFYKQPHRSLLDILRQILFQQLKPHSMLIVSSLSFSQCDFRVVCFFSHSI